MSNTVSLVPTSIPLSSNHIHLWFINEQSVVDSALVGRYIHIMSDSERRQLSTFKSTKRIQQYIITRAAIRTVLSFYLTNTTPSNIRFTTNTFGKPALANLSHQVHFNISHTKNQIVIAVTMKRLIGVDIEHMKPNRDIFNIAEHYYHQKEWNTDLLNTLTDPLKHFYKLWSLKEAFIKGKGKGFSIATQSFYFKHCDTNSPVLSTQSPSLNEKKSWLFKHSYIEPNISMALAWEDLADNKTVQITARQYVPMQSYKEIQWPII